MNQPTFKANARKRERPRLNRAEQREARTRQLLEAAWAVYCEKGYEATTIDDVAAYAGVSRMPVYSLFGDKQNLYFALWCKFIDDLSMALRSPLRPQATLREKLEQLAATAVSAPTPPRASTLAPEGLFFVVQTIALSRPDIFERLKQRANEVLADFADIVRSSALDKGDRLRATPEVIASHIIAHLNGMSTVGFQTGKSFAKQRDVADIFLAAAFKPQRSSRADP
ncbi:TetR/AcrR family transcriptional regulator [Solimonas terrae]|uniref:TetR/AcrR family transcriptional regulator n=1 Tax=Solimonas terrae TaxID=1396819 RepID=A0A6M2BT94_9GAMM|nr:TetR/AcrR family transcriptional regulator [Solimonas terrae]NGY05584.1 TetR/AcrR family transcriptional regulator [Solimonas terrae]